MSVGSRRANVLRALRGELPDWIPVVGHCNPFNRPAAGGLDPDLAATLAGIRWGDESGVLFSRALGLDIADWFGIPVKITRRCVAVEARTEGDVTTSVWHTPAGILRDVQQVCRDYLEARRATGKQAESGAAAPAVRGGNRDCLIPGNPYHESLVSTLLATGPMRFLSSLASRRSGARIPKG